MDLLEKMFPGVAANLKFEKIAIPVLSKIPVLGDIFFKQNLLTYAMYFIIPLSMFYIYRTRYRTEAACVGGNQQRWTQREKMYLRCVMVISCGT